MSQKCQEKRTGKSSRFHIGNSEKLIPCFTPMTLIFLQEMLEIPENYQSLPSNILGVLCQATLCSLEKIPPPAPAEIPKFFFLQRNLLEMLESFSVPFSLLFTPKSRGCGGRYHRRGASIPGGTWISRQLPAQAPAAWLRVRDV